MTVCFLGQCLLAVLIRLHVLWHNRSIACTLSSFFVVVLSRRLQICFHIFVAQLECSHPPNYLLLFPHTVFLLLLLFFFAVPFFFSLFPLLTFVFSYFLLISSTELVSTNRRGIRSNKALSFFFFHLTCLCLYTLYAFLFLLRFPLTTFTGLLASIFFFFCVCVLIIFTLIGAWQKKGLSDLHFATFCFFSFFFFGRGRQLSATKREREFARRHVTSFAALIERYTVKIKRKREYNSCLRSFFFFVCVCELVLVFHWRLARSLNSHNRRIRFTV